MTAFSFVVRWWRVRQVPGIALAILISACASSMAPELVSLPQPGLRVATSLDDISDYRTAAASVAAICQRDLGFASFPITFRLYPGRESFERALLESGYDPELARKTSSTMAAVGGRRAVLVNEVSLAHLSWSGRVGILAHELGHSLQYELGGGSRGTSEQWLREGFADWVSTRVLEKLNAASLAAVRRDRQREVRAAGRSRTPRLEQLVTFPQWVEAGQRQGAAAYALAFLAVDALLQRHGVPAVVGYFRRFATSQDRIGNFQAAFGEDLDSFEKSLDDRLWGR
jgi:hypothetical protein